MIMLSFPRRIAVVGIAVLLLSEGFGLAQAPAGETRLDRVVRDVSEPHVTVDFPAAETIFPPDFAAPLFQWRDTSSEAVVWRIEITGSHGPHLETWARGERMSLPAADETPKGFVPPHLTPEQESGHSWRPDAKTWEWMRYASLNGSAVVKISGYRSKEDRQAVSTGQVVIHTTRDVVGAPIFYRDVPLIPSTPESAERGAIKPLDDNLLPTIQWHLRDVSRAESKTVMTGLPTCANCHSLSRDGRTLGIDIDGPQNDKGLYALVPVQKQSSIASKYIIQWSASSDERAQKRYGFMPQVSPDGKFVVASIEPPHSTGARILDRLYSTNFPQYGFTQVFYPTRGVLGWYSKETGKIVPLPGADDPAFVHTSGFWSPDGKWIIFSRAAATDPYPMGKPRAQYANDPRETQVHYDLYRIPFNGGKGGAPERIVGASENGMSNNFPKVTPDGKWIVFVRCKNGLLMRPDSKLYIVPFEGGEARPLESNLPIMNSWHSFNASGRWMVFSSKSQATVDSSSEPTLYTRLYLTHLDEQGHASPPIPVENATASNRAVNIPEFLLGKYEDLDSIDAPATDYYKLFDLALRQKSKHDLSGSIATWRKALELDATDARAHNNFGTTLAEAGQNEEAIREFRAALELNANSSQAENNLGSVLAEMGSMAEAKQHFERAIAINPENASAQLNLGQALAAVEGNFDAAIQHFQLGLALAPENAKGQNGMGVALALQGRLDEAIPHLEKAMELDPQNTGLRYNLGRAYAATRRFDEALNQFQVIAQNTGKQDLPVLQMLAAMYYETDHTHEALETVNEALRLAEQRHDASMQQTLEADQRRYGSTQRQ